MPRTATLATRTGGGDHVMRLIRNMRASVRRLGQEVAFVARSLPWGRMPEPSRWGGSDTRDRPDRGDSPPEDDELTA